MRRTKPMELESEMSFSASLQEPAVAKVDVRRQGMSHGNEWPLIDLARTEIDYEEVSLFWYQVDCVHRGVLRAYADHQKKMLGDALMREGHLFVARRRGEIVGTVLSTYATTAKLGAYESFYELSKLAEFPGSVGITTKFMVHPKYQRSQVAVRLLQATFRKGLEDDITHAVFDCNEPLDSMFGHLGCRDHVGWKEHPDFGRVRVMMIRLRDDAPALASPGSVLASCYQNLHIKQWT